MTLKSQLNPTKRLRNFCYLKKTTYQNVFKKYNLNIGKQTLMIAYERSESAGDNFAKFIYQLQPKTKALVRKLEKDLNKII